jgi:probable selenate reductase FAD-binding subunit
VITDIVRPRTARDAVRAKNAPGAAYLGGGTWLNGSAAAAQAITTLISLEHLGLAGITAAAGSVEIGAAATLQAVVDAGIAPRALRDAALLTASRTLRTMQTIGGELGLDPADSALIPVLMVMGASVRCASKRRPIALEDFLNAKTGDLVLSVIIPDAARPAAVRAVSRTSHSPRSLVVAGCRDAARGAGSDGRGLRVVLSDCVGTRARMLQAAAPGAAPPSRERLQDLVTRVFAPGPDLHASVEYKRYMAGVLAADVVQSLQDPAAAGGAP